MPYLLLLLALLFAPALRSQCETPANLLHHQLLPEDWEGYGRTAWLADTLLSEGWTWKAYRLERPVRIEAGTVLAFFFREERPGAIHGVDLPTDGCGPVWLTGPEARVSTTPGWRTYYLRLVDAGYAVGQWVETVHLITQGSEPPYADGGAARWADVRLVDEGCAPEKTDAVEPCATVAAEGDAPAGETEGPWVAYDLRGRRVAAGTGAVRLPYVAAGFYAVRRGDGTRLFHHLNTAR